MSNDESPKSSTVGQLEGKPPEHDGFNLAEFVGDLDGGVVEQKVIASLRTVARAVRNHENNKVKGDLTIKFSMQRIGEGSEVYVGHKITTNWPTPQGKKSEENDTATLMYTNARGKLSIMPDNQTDMFRDKTRKG